MQFLSIGFSISIMKADPAVLLRLDAPTKAPSWPVGAEGRKNKPPNLLCILGTSFKVVPTYPLNG